MDEYPYRAFVRGEWSDHRKVIRQKLQVYFLSKKKSGGGDCVVECEGNTATIGFKQKEVLDRVLHGASHEIIIDKMPIQLFVTKESKKVNEKESQSQFQDQHETISASASAQEERTDDDYQPKVVVVENITEKTTREILGLIVEVVSGVAEEDYTMELIYEACVAVVTFTNSDDAKKFQAEAKHNKRFQDHRLSSRFLDRTCCLRIEDLPPQVDDELLSLYCEKMKVGVQCVNMIPEENAAIITFQKPQDVETMLSKQHKLCKVEVHVHPFHQSLGTSLYGKDRPRFKIPDSFTEAINPALLEFLLKKNEISYINDQMQSHFCQVSIQDSTVILSPLPTLLKKKGITGKRIDDWKENASTAFHNTLSKYTTLEMSINVDVCGPVTKQLHSELHDDNGVLQMDSLKGQMTLAGMAIDIENLRPIVSRIVKEETCRVEREKNSIAGEMDLHPTIFKLLQFAGLSQHITNSSPHISHTYESEKKKLVLSGLESEILSVKTWILEKKAEMIERKVDLDNHIVDFLRGLDSALMSEHLFLSHGIHAIYVIRDGAVVLTANKETSIKESVEKMEKVLAFTVLTVEDQEVLRKSEWGALKAELLRNHNTSVQIPVLAFNSNHSDHVNVAGFLEPVNKASLDLKNFLQNHSRVEDIVKVRCCAAARFIEDLKSDEWKKFAKASEVMVTFVPNKPQISLSGERISVNFAVDGFKKMANSLCTDEFKISKPGAMKYVQEQSKRFLSTISRDHSVVVLLQDNGMLEDVDDEEDERRDRKISSSGTCEVQMPCGVLIAVGKSDICKFQADAVVNAANENLKHIGGLALALLNAAGQQLQIDCDRYTSRHGPLRVGEAIITESGSLPCKHVVHAVGPKFSDTDRQTAVQHLKRAITSSLDKASGAHCTSIAIPAISSGIFGFPLDICADTIVSAVHDYFETGPGQNRTSLKKISLVNNDEKTVKAMTEAVETLFCDTNPRSESSEQALPKKRVLSDNWRGSHDEEYQMERSAGAIERKNKQPNEDKSPKEEDRPWQSPFTQSQSQWGGHSQQDMHGVLNRRQTPEGITIVLKEGNIQDAYTDVVVNTVADNMNLSQGAVSKALLQAAGPKLQSAANDQVRGGRVMPGEMVVTDGFELRCGKVFHTVCPRWDHTGGTSEKVLQKIVKDCLQEVDQQQLTSITFPAIGTGNLGFPKDLVPKIMLEETETFCRSTHPQHLKKVVIIVHPSDKDSVACFKRMFKGSRQEGGKDTPHNIEIIEHGDSHKPKLQKSSGFWGQVQKVSLGKYTVRIGHLTLELSSGDITKETTDVIVNSSNQTFSHNLGVSKAILDAAGPAVEAECSEIVNAPHYQDSGMILTSSGKLPCKHIAHVHITREDDIKEGVENVLTSCEQNQCSSISFPALGTGQLGTNVSTVAHAMIEAIVRFTKKTKSQHIKLVKILIFQPNMLSEFHQSLMAQQAKGSGDDKTIWGRVKGVVKNLFSNPGPEEVQYAEEEFVILEEKFPPVIFQLCGQTSQNLKEAKDDINRLIMKELFFTEVTDSQISRFTPEDANTLQTLQRELTVSIRLDKTGYEPVIQLEGLHHDVVHVKEKIRDMIRKVDRKDKAFIFSTVVEWQYLDGKQVVSFGMDENMKLEKAFLQKQKTPVKVQIGKREYEANLESRIASRLGGRDIELTRVDKKDQSSAKLPSHWCDMKDKHLVQVSVPTNSPEYSEIESEFRKTDLTSTIIQIDRVQNSSLWKSYMIKKEELDQKNNHTNNEKRLFHGTAADSIDKINNSGFNRSYAGSQVGAIYGNGTYFAVDAQYSAGQQYSKPDAKGHQRMYLARVLVGDYTKGAPGMISPPAKTTGNTADTYDSVTDDDTNNPTMFVVFNDVQAYPEYIITFQ
ncbi:protein mono-ADP-ribosyltransferase PARP14-like [Engraulis encrasicolus]|uniref:protein mono-ADP-ribosyltransferase PARP14-like n=1 Tax=Engraulis encrasicolus TaxID=184585 RepID=UPI002FCE749B